MKRLIVNTKNQRVELHLTPIERPGHGDARLAAALAGGIIAKVRACGRKPTAVEVIRQVRRLLDESGRKLTQDELSRLVEEALNLRGQP